MRSAHEDFPFIARENEQAGYIDKHFPLTSQRPKARDVRYRLLDPFLRFWFRFIYPHTSLIAQVGAHPTPRSETPAVLYRTEHVINLKYMLDTLVD